MPLRVLLLCLLSSVPLYAESSVWKISRGGKSLFLGGTLHVLRLSDFPLPPEFGAAFAQSARIVLETDVSQMQSPQVQAKIASAGFYTDGSSLKNVLSPAAWQAASTHCAKAGLPLEHLQRMKPWLFALTVTIVELQKIGVSSEGVDLHFYKQAREARKPLGELETLDEQIEFITRLGDGHESDLVLKSIEDVATLPRTMDQAIAAWRRGDIATLHELLLGPWIKKYPAILQGLLFDRNHAWLPKLNQLLDTAEVELVLVGAGHLSGPQGLLALLERGGCKVEKLSTPIPAAPTSSTR